MISQDAVITGLVVALVGIIVVAAVLLWAMQRGPGAMVPPAPAPTVGPLPALPLADLSQYLDFYEKQLTVFRRRIADLETQIADLEKRNAALGERADELEARNRLIENKLISQYDHTDYIYRSVGEIANSPILVAGLKERDPRYRSAPIPPSVPPTPPGVTS